MFVQNHIWPDMTLVTKWWRATVIWLCLCTNVSKPTWLLKERINLDPYIDEKKGRERGKSWIWGGEITWWEAELGGGDQYTDGEGERRKGEHRADRGTGQGALCRSLACSGPLQAAAQNRALGSPFFFFFLLRCQRKGRGFTEEASLPDTKRWETERAPPEMDRGGSLRRRLSSLRGAWRWSTGHLFRKVGRDGWMEGWVDGVSYEGRVTRKKVVSTGVVLLLLSSAPSLLVFFGS